MPLLHAELSEKIIGCCIRVHKEMGSGFLEKIYEEALCIELTKAGLAYERQKTIDVLYQGTYVGEHRLDLEIEGSVVLELKAAAGIEDIHLATAKSYLKATGHQLALVVNFARPIIEIKRVVLTR